MLEGFCGLRLSTAGVVIGWIGAAWSLFVTILVSIGLANVNELAKMIGDSLNHPDLNQETIKQFLLIVLSVYITINAINLVASALLITGTVKERHLLLVPWLMNSGLSLLFNGAYMVYIVIAGISGNVAFGSIVVPLISTGIQFYIWYAIYSLYKQIQSNRDEQQRLLPSMSSTYPSYTEI